MLMSDERVEKALAFLVSSDTTCANAKALMKRLDYQRNTIRSLAMVEVEGDANKNGEKLSVSTRESRAYISKAYQEYLKKFEKAVADYEILNNQRNTAIGHIEVWRSEQANRRRGNI